MAETKYFVVGGEYADTSFTRMADGREEERYGPFDEQAAHDFWRKITGQTVDNAMTRYVIRPNEEVEGRAYWVVGGEYADTSFTRMAEGHALEKYGPFTRKEALEHWRKVTGRTVDNAMARYDVVGEDELERMEAEGQVS